LKYSWAFTERERGRRGYWAGIFKEPMGARNRVFTKVAFGISRKSKFYTKMGIISRNFE
jgi:hypothetical protein